MLLLDPARGAQAHRHAVAEAEDDQVIFARLPGGIDPTLAQRHRLLRRRVFGQPQAVAGFVQILGHVQRDRLQEGADAAVHFRQCHHRAQHGRGIVAARRAADHQPRDVAQCGDRVVVVEMAAEAALVAQRRDAHHHRVAVLAVAEELQAGRLAADLVAGVVEISEVLDFRHRQHADVGVTLCQAEDDGFVQQRIEHALVAEGLVQAFGDRINAALLRHVLTEQQRFRILAEQIVQRLIDLDRQMLRWLFLGQFGFAAERGDALVGVIEARGLGLDFVGRVRRQRPHHGFQRRQARAAVGILSGSETLRAGRFVQREDVVLRHQSRFQRNGRAAQQRIAGLDRA